MTDTTTVVPSIGRWASNAHLIADAHSLGYLHADWRTLDPTYGLGNFWTIWQPDRLVRTDLDPAKSPDWTPGCDFRATPWKDAAFDAVVLDPPYKLRGTPALGEFDRRYGLEPVLSWQDVMRLIRDGLTEAARVHNRVGTLILKCQDQVCSGAKRWQTIDFTVHAATLGYGLVDRFDMVGGVRPQPSGRRQVHTAGQASTLLVFRHGWRTTLEVGR